MDQDFWRKFLLQSLTQGRETASPFQFAGPGAYSDGDPKPFDTAEQARQGNLMQDVNQIIFDPNFGAMTGALGIDGGLDYGQLAQDEYEPQDMPSKPVASTFALESLRSDPQGAIIADMIEAGTSQAIINEAIRKSKTITSDDMRDDLIAEAATAVTEYRANKTAQSQYEADVAAMPAPERILSPVEEAYRDAGLPLPTELYGGEFFDPSLGAKRDNAKSKGKTARDLQSKLQARMGEADVAQHSNDFFADLYSPERFGGVRESGTDVTQGATQTAPQNGALSIFGNAAAGKAPIASQAGSVGGGERYWAQAPMQQIPDVSALMAQARTAQANSVGASGASSFARRIAEAQARTAATMGRTPTGDAITARQLAMRAYGLG